MTFPICTENNHAPFKDQIDDETVMFDLDMTVDTLPDTPLKNDDCDSDTQKTRTNQSSNSLSAIPSRRESKIRSDMSRSASVSGLTDNVNLEDIYEYDWADSDSESPGGKHEKESYIVQEILADFLKVKSFKRKYPDLTRRAMDAYERSWLQQEGIVPVGRADLGLTALKTDDVMKLLRQDYPEIHIALTDLFRRRRFKTAIENQKRQYEAARIERGEARAEAARRRALDSAADYNHRLISERMSSRRCYWDLQTMQIHIPQRIYKLLDYPTFPEGAYPVAVIPGQFAEYFVNYTPGQLSYLPLSRALYPHPLRKHRNPPPLPTALRFGSIKPKFNTPVMPSCDFADQNSLGLDNSRSMDFLNHQTMNSIESHRTGYTNGSLSSSGVTNSNMLSGGDKSSISDLETDKTGNSIYRRYKTNIEINTENPVCIICGQLAMNYIRCSECKLTGHPKCLDIPDSMLSGVKSYDWTCLECKRCVECNDSGQEDQMMFCDRCDRGYHAFCVGLGRIPNGKWECLLCESLPTPPRKGRPRKNRPKDSDDLPWGYSVKKPRKSPLKRNTCQITSVNDIKDISLVRSSNLYSTVQSTGVASTEVPKRRRGRPPTKNRIITSFPPPSSYFPTSDLSISLPLSSKVCRPESEPSRVCSSTSIILDNKESSIAEKIDASEKSENLNLNCSSTVNETESNAEKKHVGEAQISATNLCESSNSIETDQLIN
ncbi:PHD finger protein 10 [Schistosoma japonicum]|nr:PHD finger protein 10 [Schistosoma japonicum]